MTEKDLDIAIEKCERIMEMDTRTLKNPESEDGWLFDKVYDLLKFLRQLQFGTDTNVGGNLIDRQAAIKAADSIINRDTSGNNDVVKAMTAWQEYIKALPSAQPGQRNAIVFQGIVVEYPSISAYPEYEGKPYFSIKYTENGQEFIGYGTYKPEVLSEYLKEYFMSPAQPNLSEAYSKAVFTWLRDYQIRAAELKGRYTPYEVLSWVANDWRKEHERFD